MDGIDSAQAHLVMNDRSSYSSSGLAEQRMLPRPLPLVPLLAEIRP